MNKNLKFKLNWLIIYSVILIIFFSCVQSTTSSHKSHKSQYPQDQQGQQTSPLPWLSVVGRYIQDPNGKIVILRGVSLTDLSYADHSSHTAIQRIDMATDAADGWYAHVIRLPVYPDTIDGQPGWNQGADAYFNDHLKPAIQECIARKVYCIIDWHYIGDYDSVAVDTATRNFWSYVVPIYANTPNVIFELFNEANRPTDWSTWKSIAQPWVNIIRSYAPKNLILVTGPNWSKNMSGAVSDPFSGGNIVYVSHIYPKFGDQTYWDTSWGNYTDTVPFFITEWGWQNNTGGDIIEGTLTSFGIPFSQYLDAKGVSWTAWVFCNYWRPIMFDLNWNLLGGEDYMGQFTKDLLSQRQFAIGDIGPSGVGIVFYVTAGGLHGLEAAPSQWNGGADPVSVWSNITTLIGTTSVSIGEGLDNSNMILNQSGHTQSAAKLCRDYTGGGKTDWFLPSRDELNKLYVHKTEVGGFEGARYWCSSEENNSNETHSQNFNAGDKHHDPKNQMWYVRPIRAF